MGDKTNIEWTDSTWNPMRGCSRVSERRVLEQPIPCRGFQKFWKVPDEIARLVS